MAHSAQGGPAGPEAFHPGSFNEFAVGREMDPSDEATVELYTRALSTYRDALTTGYVLSEDGSRHVPVAEAAAGIDQA